MDIFLIFAQNRDFGYTLEGDSNRYPQSMIWIKNKKNRYTPVNPSFTIKVGFTGYALRGHVFVMYWSLRNKTHKSLWLDFYVY